MGVFDGGRSELTCSRPAKRLNWKRGEGVDREEMTPGAAVLVFGASVAVVVLGLRLKAGMQLPVLMGAAVAAAGAWLVGVRWPAIQSAMSAGVVDGLPAVSILLLVGINIGLFIACGAIPSLISYVRGG